MKEKNIYTKNATKFWNDFQNIKWFNDEMAPQYWIDFLSPMVGKNIKSLDLGCGAGRNTELMYRLGFDYYGIDLHKNMIENTKKRLLSIGADDSLVNKKIKEGNMLNIDFNNSSFDVIISNGVFHNAYSLEELEKSISESSRLLKTNGFLCFNLFSSEAIDTFKNLGNSVFLTKENLIMTLISSKEFEKICKKYGLESHSPIVEYQREVSTGLRSIMRGVMIKK